MMRGPVRRLLHNQDGKNLSPLVIYKTKSHIRGDKSIVFDSFVCYVRSFQVISHKESLLTSKIFIIDVFKIHENNMMKVSLKYINHCFVSSNY